MSGSFSLVLIHGHGVDASIWDNIQPELSADIRVIKPNFAHSTSHTTIEAYAEELNAQLQSAGIDKVVLAGHSMGGYIALAYAERYPEQVHGLVLYHSTAYADDADRKIQRQQLIDTMKAQGGAQFIEKQLPKMVAPHYPAEKTQELVARFRGLPTEALIAGMKAIAGRPDRTHVLRDAQYPVLLVLGREDQLISVEKTKALADLSDRIGVSIIDNAGHLSMIEQPETSVLVLRNFLQQADKA
ncbi:alpha/beta hydrolase [Spirosoma sp. SC4-14]|uniref:alpha/beta fold hydrolase n=1 Tax=Spirosoma sp. SC4-14 TaxID=3128900 RepID=UPI0030D0EB45